MTSEVNWNKINKTYSVLEIKNYFYLYGKIRN